MKRALWWIVLAAGPLCVIGVWTAWALGLANAGLIRVAAWYLGQMASPLAGLLALLLAAIIAWRDPDRRPLAGASAVLGLLALVPILMLLGVWTPRFPATIEGSSPAVTVRLPLDGPLVVGWGGDTVAENYHAATPDQRWAYDLLVEPAAHGSADLTSYGCYGLPVLAPASGTISMAHDGEPDQDPSTFVPNPTAPAGNYVVIELETGTHLLLAHLVPGSVTVAVGDVVEEGQQLGRCGNSGNTSEPHVHIHHQKQLPEQIGFGQGLPLYFRDHDGEPMPKGGVQVEGETVTFTGDRVQHVGR